MFLGPRFWCFVCAEDKIDGKYLSSGFSFSCRFCPDILSQWAWVRLFESTILMFNIYKGQIEEQDLSTADSSIKHDLARSCFQLCEIFYLFFIEIWFFDNQNKFYLIVKGLKNAFFMPFRGCQNEGSAFCKWWSWGAGLLQMIIPRAAAVRGGIGDSSSWMKLDLFLYKIRFRTHISYMILI